MSERFSIYTDEDGHFPKHAVTFHSGDKLNLFLANSADEAERMARSAADAIVKCGKHGVIWPDGRREHGEWRGRWENGDYVWHADGERTKHDFVHVFVGTSGCVKRVIIKSAWRRYGGPAQ